MKRSWIIPVLFGIGVGISIIVFDRLTRYIHFSRYLLWLIFLLKNTILPGIALSILRQGKTRVSYFHALLTTFVTLLIGWTIVLCYLIFNRHRITGRWYLMLDDLWGMLMIAGIIISLSAVIALVFVLLSKPSHRSNSLDDPHF